MKLPCSDVARVPDRDSPRDLSARRRGDQFERSGELAGNVSQISVYETDKVVDEINKRKAAGKPFTIIAMAEGDISQKD